MTTRREAIAGLVALAVAMRTSALMPAVGKATPFSWDILQQRALDLSRRPWQASPKPSPLIETMNYDAAGQVQFRADRALWREHDDNSATRFFPLTKNARHPVSISVTESGMAQRLAYSPSLYEIPARHPMSAMGQTGGFSGFRFMNKGGVGDWMAFQGASYFRAAGPLHQYGLSARGLAINTGMSGPEEFPEFTDFWLERGEGGAIIVYALLDSPSATGAYRFINRQGTDETVQDVSMVVHMRQSVVRIGIAPLTSMFWYGEGNRTQARDWRPEIHDSDGLAIRMASGERIWRPLVNPPQPKVNSFAAAAPRGFGLLQRDRQFDHYQDDAIFNEKRPSLWIEPQGDWGHGAVTLYEIPTTTEYADNIVAFWTPAAGASAGQRLAYDYRMRWIGTEPEPLSVAHVINCWTGQGGVPGQPPQANAAKIVIDFEGPRFAGLGGRSTVKPVVDVANGRLLNTGCYPIDGLVNCWRMIVDVERGRDGPVDIRAFLQKGGDALTETLIYQLS
ncbi:glucan biosynthesis protein [Sphingobium boeckii]|uniref:Glucans biosynthesis protein n=1 Tax=Sphingobium boeckii TaxID=1082345 RepID=A0A7W9AKN5_9SPHN|nr:glucan biosynthesis protein [Sphingobium boeckii]MBB5687443.1 glucans biosynthesis protein [Sphingobium boeckii]